jgi:hypothetical protein
VLVVLEVRIDKGMGHRGDWVKRLRVTIIYMIIN